MSKHDEELEVHEAIEMPVSDMSAMEEEEAKENVILTTEEEKKKWFVDYRTFRKSWNSMVYCCALVGERVEIVLEIIQRVGSSMSYDASS
jgi:hypothetical protein